ncbi:hypothetical protein [Alcaligenes sp. WGS1538]|uniref:hypothetical protein n=1 Tax=Alcaligenes sp. WGS1538 TaxID=3366811 RepID=UPI00372D73A0
MSKATMPNPAVVTTGPGPDDVVYSFTSAQMEAYAAAKVREALEEAAHICWSMQCSDECERELHDRLLSNAEKRIRALIPK